MNCAKIAEPIEMPFGMWTRVGPRKNVFDGGAHYHNLSNTIQPSACGGDAAFLPNYFDLLLLMGVATNKEVKTTFCDACFVSDEFKDHIDTEHSDRLNLSFFAGNRLTCTRPVS